MKTITTPSNTRREARRTLVDFLGKSGLNATWISEQGWDEDGYVELLATPVRADIARLEGLEVTKNSSGFWEVRRAWPENFDYARFIELATAAGFPVPTREKSPDAVDAAAYALTALAAHSVSLTVAAPIDDAALRGRWSNGDPVHIITDGETRTVAPNLNGATWIPESEDITGTPAEPEQTGPTEIDRALAAEFASVDLPLPTPQAPEALQGEGGEQ